MLFLLTLFTSIRQLIWAQPTAADFQSVTRLSDRLTYDKSNLTRLPNALFIATIPADQILFHIRHIDVEMEDPIWFCLDFGFCRTVFGQTRLRVQTFRIQDSAGLENVVVVDGRSTILNDLTDLLVFGHVTGQGYGLDSDRIRGLCQLFPNVNGFARQMYGFEVVLCHRVHQQGRVKLVRDVVMDHGTGAPSGLHAVTSRRGSESGQLRVSDDSMLVFDPAVGAKSIEYMGPYLNASRQKVVEFRRQLETLLSSQSVLKDNVFSLAVDRLRNQFGILLTVLKQHRGVSTRSILGSFAHPFGMMESVRFEERVDACVHNWGVPQHRPADESNPPSKLRFQHDIANGDAPTYPSLRHEIVQNLTRSINSVTRHLCLKLITMHDQNTTFAERKVMVQDLKLQWRELADCPKPCADVNTPGFVCIKGLAGGEATCLLQYGFVFNGTLGIDHKYQ